MPGFAGTKMSLGARPQAQVTGHQGRAPGGNLGASCKQLGHSQLSSTEHYTRVEGSDLRRMLRLHHPRAWRFTVCETQQT